MLYHVTKLERNPFYDNHSRLPSPFLMNPSISGFDVPTPKMGSRHQRWNKDQVVRSTRSLAFPTRSCLGQSHRKRFSPQRTLEDLASRLRQRPLLDLTKAARNSSRCCAVLLLLARSMLSCLAELASSTSPSLSTISFEHSHHQRFPVHHSMRDKETERGRREIQETLTVTSSIMTHVELPLLSSLLLQA
jgi:hypothetical protein